MRALAGKLDLAELIVFAGFVPSEALPVFFELCEVFAMPHRELCDGDTEGGPTVFLEAGVHGKSVVGGRVGGVRDAIQDGDTELLVDGENPRGIAGAIVTLLSEKALATRLGDRVRQRALNELNPAKGAERLLEYCRRRLDGMGTV